MENYQEIQITKKKKTSKFHFKIYNYNMDSNFDLKTEKEIYALLARASELGLCTLSDLAKYWILQKYKENDCNKVHTAKVLGVCVRSVRNWINDWMV